MIARIWHGWTTHAKADAYEKLLRSHVLPGIHRIAGYRGAYLLREEHEDEVEFVTVTLFESAEDVRAFAGEDYTLAVISPDDRRYLTRFDLRVAHYSVVDRVE